MALKRLSDDEVYRFLFAAPNAFANFETPTTAELNVAFTPAPANLVHNLTCALNQDGSQFDLDDSERDETLTFCQIAGDSTEVSRSASIVFQYEMAKKRWTPASSVLAADGFNTANLAHSLLAWRGIEGYAVMSIGKASDQTFAVGDRLKIAQVSTDVAIPEIGTGENVRWTQTFAKRTDLNWNYTLAS